MTKRKKQIMFAEFFEYQITKTKPEAIVKFSWWL